MKLKALIVDDEPLAHQVILRYVTETPFIDIVGQVYSGTQALLFLQETPVDLLFLDIQMPKLKGLDFLRILDRKPIVIVTSAYQEYALESYELDVCDYLLKPYRLDRFIKAAYKAQRKFNNQSGHRSIEVEPSSPDLNPATILIKVDKKYIQIQCNDIDYLEGFGNYVKIWMSEQFHLTPRTLSSFEKLLPNRDFFRVHKSYIINRHRVDYVEGNQVFLTDGKVIPIGKKQKRPLINILGHLGKST